MATAGGTDFDPTAGRFSNQDRRPGNWIDVDPARLQPLMRGLLVIDGTVTKILEAYFLEPVDVRQLSQSIGALECPDNWLDAAVGEPIVCREVALVGQRSNRLYAYAESKIVLNRLSRRMQDSLDEKMLGLGRILRDGNAEMRRECMWYGQERLENVPDAVGAYGSPEFVCRTYRVISLRAPADDDHREVPAGSCLLM